MLNRIFVFLLSAAPLIASAQAVVTPTMGPTLNGPRDVVANGPGNQYDPHVSAPWVAYTDDSSGGSEIRYHNLTTGQDAAVPSTNGLDSLSAISGNVLVYNHFTSTAAAIFSYDIGGGSAPQELDPQPGSYRIQSSIGGNTVAWQDFGFHGSSRQFPELVAYDRATQTTTRLTDDLLYDGDPAVSPGGDVIVFKKCQTSTSGCDIYSARRVGGSWTVQPLTSGPGEESLPDATETMAIYNATRNGEEDLYWQPVAGGPETRLALSGPDHNPHIAGHLVAFEHFDSAASPANWDIYVYDMATNVLYRLTQTPDDERLNDIDVDLNGLARVVWSVQEGPDQNVYGFSFQPSTCDPHVEPVDVCQNPGDRPLLASLNLTRTRRAPPIAWTKFAAQPTDDAVLCIDNRGATAGEVVLNEHPQADPSDLHHSTTLIARKVSLCSENVLAATLAGEPGSGFTVRVYGPQPGCVAPPTSGSGGSGHSIPPEVQAWMSAHGCSASGAGTSLLAAVAVLGALAFLRPRAPDRVRARRGR